MTMNSRGDVFIRAVAQFADTVLEHGKDRYGSAATPLLADGLQVQTLAPVEWSSDGERWIVSNLANQQHLFRTLVGLSRLTGEDKYRHAADEALRYAFQELRYGDLLWWGGHMTFDLADKKKVFASDKGPQHELKCHFPFYEWMHEVDEVETRKYIEAFWDSHITDWSNLEFSRHGKPVEAPEGGVWSRTYAGGEVFFEGRGLTFINAGSDLIYAASMLHKFSGDERPLQWANQLARRYVETRHLKTGLGGYQFSISILPGQRGDRAIEQFGEQLRQHQPIEATLTSFRQLRTILGPAAICKLTLAEKLGSAGEQLGQWAAEDLAAYGRYAYDMHDNTFHPILTNGTRLTGLVMEKDGYYGRKGEAFKSGKGDALLLWSYVLGFRQTEDSFLWSIARNIALDLGLGEIGSAPGQPPALLVESACSDPLAICALLELYRWSEAEPYLAAAEHIGHRVLERTFRNGLFLRSEDLAYVKLDCPEALILLQLAGALSGRLDLVPAYVAGQGFFGAAYDGLGHKTDNDWLYRQTKA
ncbi:hypothetical protein [Paenibacillus cremeus]|uniref:Pectate lyase n=1 Tax=Paenibacillus cremeus TaxID=2163881 RepID=A0A559K4L6_9BACL|nr:hypothetical protein [Paenibacillus cremeus]TVY07082.1 hypothetical protein FPZ49_25770 [Paenibacillus cremeus]